MAAAAPAGKPGAEQVVAPGADADGDGIVSAFDVDDNGNGILDNMDPAQALPLAGKSFWIFSNFKVDLERSVNAYLPGYSAPRAAAIFKSAIALAVQVRGWGRWCRCRRPMRSHSPPPSLPVAVGGSPLTRLSPLRPALCPAGAGQGQEPAAAGLPRSHLCPPGLPRAVLL